MMCASLFIVPFTTLLPVFARDLLGVGATGQEGPLTAMGIGALCSAVLLASLGDRLPRGLLMLWGVTVYGLSVVAFAASPSFRLSLGLMTLVGLAHVSSHALVQTVIQTYSPSAFRGRTMAIFHMSSVVMTLGSMLAGMLAALVGARWAVAAMGATGAMIMVTIGCGAAESPTHSVGPWPITSYHACKSARAGRPCCGRVKRQRMPAGSVLKVEMTIVDRQSKGRSIDE